MKGDTLVGKMFSEKSLTMPKKTERGTLWDFSTSILSQNSRKLKGDPSGKIVFQKNNAEKAEMGDPLVSLLVELFWSLQVYRKKTLTRSLGYSRLFS